jgi:antitoxin HicB
MSMTRRYTVLLDPGEDGWLIATVPAFPGCITQGRSRDEALSNAREAIELTIESMLAHGEPLPEEQLETVEVAV